MSEKDASGEYYRAFVQNSTDGIWQFATNEPISVSLPEDEQLNALYRKCFVAEANDAFARMYGHESGEALAGVRLDNLLPRDVASNEVYLRAFLRADYHLSDAQFVETDGQGNSRYFSCTLTGTVEAGKLIRAWGTQRDITAQRRSEAALRQSEERLGNAQARLEAALWAGGIATCNIDVTNNQVTGDATLARFLGVGTEAVAGVGLQIFLDAIYEEDRARASQALYDALESGADEYEDEYRVVTAMPAGELFVRWLYARARVERDPSGVPVSLSGAIVDITARRRAEQEQAVSEGRIRALYELTSRTDFGFSEKIQRLLRAGREWLHLNTGVLARSDCDTGMYEVVQIDALGEALPVGFTCPLEQTFCSETVKRGPEAKPLAVENAGQEAAWSDHAVRKVFGCEAYIGAVVRVNGEAWGTLAFLASTPRQERFAEFDKDVVRLMAQWIGGEIARQEAQAALVSGAERQRRFLRDMVSSMTEGKFHLCLGETDLPAPLSRTSEEVELGVRSMRVLRLRVKGMTEALCFDKERAQDIETGVGEAAMNAATHGGGGVGWVCADQDRGMVQVWIIDTGQGITDEALPRVLEKGVSTAGTLGHGFWLMLRTCDRVHLLTGPFGTTVVLEVDRTPPAPIWLQGSV